MRTWPWRRILLAFGLALILATTGWLYSDRHAVYRQILLAGVARSQTDAATQEDALRIFEHVLELVPLRARLDGRLEIELDPQSPPVPSFAESPIDDDPAGTLTRGWAYCDSLAIAFVQVAERRGFRGQLLFLLDERGRSPHSVATIELDGKFRVFDVLAGVAPRLPDGTIATIEDIATGRAPSTGSWIEASWFRSPRVFYQTPDRSGIREWGRNAALVAADLLARSAGALVQDLYLQTEPPTYRDIRGQVWTDWSGPGDRSFWRARNYELLGRWDRASTAYEEVIAVPGATFADEARFLLFHLDSRQSAERS